MATLTLHKSNAVNPNFPYATDFTLDRTTSGWSLLDGNSGTVFGAISGSGLVYNAYNNPTQGDITGAKSLASDGSASWTISGLSLAANTSYTYVQSTLQKGNAFDYYMINTMLIGNDTINGSTGDDIIYYSAGSDVINAGTGNDWMSFSNSVYTNTVSVDLSLNKYTVQSSAGSTVSTITNVENIIGSINNDTLVGNSGNNIFIGGKGDDAINGGTGTDTVNYSLTAGVTVNLSTGTGAELHTDLYTYSTDTLTSIENVVGSAFNDTITGNSSSNVLTGGAGNDTIDGGTGTDTADYSTAYNAVKVSLTSKTASGQGTDSLLNIENVTGSRYSDSLTGNTGANTLYAGSGDDTVHGGAGNDILNGGSGSDTAYYTSATSAVKVNLALTTAQITGGAGTDTLISIESLTGGKYSDTLTGNSSANTLNGGGSNDKLSGDSGNDVLIGGTGRDTLTGGAGYDTFKFNAINESVVGTNRDVITYFSNGVDKIDLSAIDANVFSTGDQAFKLISSTTAFSAAGQIKLSSGILYGEVTGDGVADFEIALTGVTAVTSTDFIL